MESISIFLTLAGRLLKKRKIEKQTKKHHHTETKTLNRLLFFLKMSGINNIKNELNLRTRFFFKWKLQVEVEDK